MNRRGITVFFDPIATVLDVVRDLYPQLSAEVVFNGNCDGAHGCTVFPDDGSTPQVAVNAKTPYGACAEILAHELAHVVAGSDAEHGPAWQEAFDRIHAEYERRLSMGETETQA